MSLTINMILLFLTCGVSIYAFQNSDVFSRFMFNAYEVWHRKQYYRLFSHGLIHGGWMHLIVNMLVLYSFGQIVELYYSYNAIGGKYAYLLMYVLALPLSSVVSLRKHRDNPFYNAVGASGAVSAVVFSFIFLDPWNKLYLFFALPIPGIVFGGLYIWYSYYMSDKESDGIGHEAHLTGAIFGILFTMIAIPGSFQNFIYRLTDF
ncbi:MAG TPA: rhomboid family intramembrane serine protease [Paludibacteraceae bacterium]|nr:rhomboid family intramembrane serine protease [Paludibacteraceae bacterium]HOU68072.1 rhomboid family intramembrane serine protease [Paludibacteraceae bacterium]HPH64076.1 rhomboid family intramembrane serine protease [Paludibacteraceae bacterium]HQF49908.1 rhomboid family intramembrane serine protease [Paludibacteraceae bacterium]